MPATGALAGLHTSAAAAPPAATGAAAATGALAAPADDAMQA